MPLLLMLINFCEIMAIIFKDLPEMKRKLIADHLKKEKQFLGLPWWRNG